MLVSCKKQVRHQVLNQVWDQLEYQVLDQVYDQVKTQVYHIRHNIYASLSQN